MSAVCLYVRGEVKHWNHWTYYDQIRPKLKFFKYGSNDFDNKCVKNKSYG